jgi:hypothetical protein
VPSWIDALKTRLRSAAQPNGPEIYRDLRSLALGVDPASIDVPDGESWSGAAVAAMELNIDGAIATIVTIADGSTSMYLSSGGGVIGAGEHAAVRAVAQRFRTVAAELRGLFERSATFPTPEAGEVRFHLRMLEGGFTAAAPESSLRSGRHALAALYAAGQDVITEVRLATPD